MAIIPSKQKAVLAEDHGPEYRLNVVEDFPVPKLKPQQVLVKLEYTGVCHSDLSVLRSEWNFVPPPEVKVPGHEGVGRIVAVGSTVSTEDVPIGLKVGVPLISNPCFNCAGCLGSVDGELACEKANSVWDRAFYGELRNGTYQQYVEVDKNYIIPVPESCPNELVGPVLCGGVTVYKGIKRSGLRAGQWLIVPGAGGGLGTMAVQYARAAGLRVIGIDAAAKKDLVLGLGAESFIDFSSEDVKERVMEITACGAHGVLMLAPIESAYASAPDLLRFGGTLVCIGLPQEHVTFKVSPHTVINKCLNIVGSFVGTRADMAEALDFVSRGVVKPTVTVFKMEDISKVFEHMHKGELQGRAVLKLE